MFSVFKSPTLTNRRNITQENNVTARKPGQLSMRKPFADRPVNVTQNETASFVKPKAVVKNVVTIQNEEKDFDPSLYLSSFRDVKDNYNDLRIEKELLGKKGFANIHNSFLRMSTAKDPEVPKFVPEIINVPDIDDFEDNDPDEICSLFKNDFTFKSTAPFPSFELDFSF